MPEEHDLLVLAKKIRWDLDSTRAKLSELIRGLAALDLPDPTERECQKCHAVFPGKLSLAEHDYLSHAGPEPEHWVAAEKQAADV